MGKFCLGGGLTGLGIGYGERGGKGERGRVQRCNYWFTTVFIGDGAAHAGACCHVCGCERCWLDSLLLGAK